MPFQKLKTKGGKLSSSLSFDRSKEGTEMSVCKFLHKTTVSITMES